MKEQEWRELPLVLKIDEGTISTLDNGLRVLVLEEEYMKYFPMNRDNLSDLTGTEEPAVRSVLEYMRQKQVHYLVKHHDFEWKAGKPTKPTWLVRPYIDPKKEGVWLARGYDYDVFSKPLGGRDVLIQGFVSSLLPLDQVLQSLGSMDLSVGGQPEMFQQFYLKGIFVEPWEE